MGDDCRPPKTAGPHDGGHVVVQTEHAVHDPKRMLPLCLAHHRAEHDGRLVIEGDADAGFVFYHGNRTPYGSTTAPESTMAWADAFTGMKNLGFKEGQARRALEAARPHVAPEADTETILRAALRQLRLDTRTGKYDVRRTASPPRL